MEKVVLEGMSTHQNTVTVVTKLWDRLLFLGESYLYISNFKSVWTSLNFPFALLSLHQPQHCQLWLASLFQAISSIMGAVSWVPLRPGACWDVLRTVSLCHIVLPVFLVREEQYWPRGRYRKIRKEFRISSKFGFLCCSLYQLLIAIPSF